VAIINSTKVAPGSTDRKIGPNKSALYFWRKAISNFTKDQYLEEIKVVDCRGHEAPRYILSFNTVKHDI